nr:collagen alpha-1(II) chain-like [Pan paniscus]
MRGQGRRKGHRGSPARPSGAVPRVLRGCSTCGIPRAGSLLWRGKEGASASEPSSAARRSLPAQPAAPGGGARPGSRGVTRSSGRCNPGRPWGHNLREVSYPCVSAGPLGHWERNEVVMSQVFSKIRTRHQTEEAGAPESTQGRVGEEGGRGCSAGAGRPQPRGTRRRAKTSHPAREGREGPREGAPFQPGETRVLAASLSSRQRAPVLTPAPFPRSMLLTKWPGEECRSPRGQALPKH